MKIGSRITLDTIVHDSKHTFDLEVTLTFDLPIIQLHVMNAHILKHIRTKFGKVAVDGPRVTAAHGRREGWTEGQRHDRPQSSSHSIPSLKLGTQ